MLEEQLIIPNSTEDGCSYELNLSWIPFPNQDALLAPLPWVEYAKVALYAVVLSAALVGNMGVVVTVAMNRGMRTPINLYLSNLAVADLLICAFCMWVPLANSLTSPIYSLGPFLCKINPFAQMTCLTCSVLTLSAVSCDRFTAILFPLHVRITKRRTGAVISGIWALSIAVAIPFLFVQTYRIYQWRDMSEAACHDEWPREERWDATLGTCIRRYPLKQLYYCLVCVVLFFVPVSVMVGAYLLIVARLWRAHAPGEANIANIHFHHRAKKKVIRLVCAVVLVFVLCWSPFQAAVLYSQFGHSASEEGELPSWFEGFYYCSLFLAYSNSALNPLLYGGLNHNFRKGMLSMLRCATPPIGRPQFSQKSRTTLLTGSPTSGRVNGVGPASRVFELRTLHDETTIRLHSRHSKDSI